MKWKFDCYKCGQSYMVAHASVSKDVFLSGKKEGRPHMNCVNCEEVVLLVGDLVGNRK